MSDVPITLFAVVGTDYSLPPAFSYGEKHVANLARFSMGKAIVVGHKTLPTILAGQEHPDFYLFDDIFVLTHDKKLDFGEDIVPVYSAKDAIAKATDYINSDPGRVPTIFVFGGAEAFHAFMPYAHNIYITMLSKEFSSKRYFPEISVVEWDAIEHAWADDTREAVHKLYVRRER